MHLLLGHRPTFVMVLSAFLLLTSPCPQKASAESRVWMWGSNYYGELGRTTNNWAPDPSPAELTGLGDFVQVGGGFLTSFVHKLDGTVWTWGLNDIGQLGIGTFDRIEHPDPVQVRLSNVPDDYLTEVVQMVDGRDNRAVVRSDGTVWAWGWNGCGQLGIGTTDFQPHPYPVQVKISAAPGDYLTGVKKISTVMDHAFAIKWDGSVWGWGCNNFGQLGLGHTSDVEPYAVEIPGLSGVTSIGTGFYYTVALLENGDMLTWGINNPTNQQITSIVVLSDVKHISPGPFQAAAIKTDGTLWIWEPNTDVPTPTQLVLPGPVADVSMKPFHGIAALEDGTVYTWGSNSDGELGYGTIDWDSHSEPKQVPGLEGINKVMNGGFFSIAMQIENCVDVDGDGITTCAGDCDDNDREVFPENTERCDNKDNNCNGMVDEGDRDDDGIADCNDICPDEDATSFDTDSDGCIDSLSALSGIVASSVAEGAIAEQLQNSIFVKIENALKANTKGKTCAAVNQLEALKNMVNAQKGHKISDETANLMISYLNSIIAYFQSLSSAEKSC